MTDRDALDEVYRARERRQRRFEVKWTEKPPKKPILPDLPGHDDVDGQCTWVTSVLHLDPERPIVGGKHSGLVGGRGHITLSRGAAAPAIAFKPASRIGKGDTLAADLVWQLVDTDDKPYAWGNQQATSIALVVHWLCDASGAMTSRQETAQILTAFVESSEQVEGNTYGTTGERYEAVVALRPQLDGHGNVETFRYLADTTRPELVIRTGDLAVVARRVRGASLERGWLEGQMDEFDWDRLMVQGQSMPGREGRVRGRHARIEVYRGPIASLYGNEDDDSVNT